MQKRENFNVKRFFHMPWLYEACFRKYSAYQYNCCGANQCNRKSFQIDSFFWPISYLTIRFSLLAHNVCVCMFFLSLHFSIPLCEFSILIFFFFLHFPQIHNDTDCLHACIFTRNHCPQQQILHGYTMFMKFMLRIFLSLLAPVFFLEPTSSLYARCSFNNHLHKSCIALQFRSAFSESILSLFTYNRNEFVMY